jgi:hypothetical protein
MGEITIRNVPRTPKTVTASKLHAGQWAAAGRFYVELLDIFKHTWSFELTHYVDGKPSIHVRVFAPQEDACLYDDAVIDAFEKDPVPGYFFDGTDIDSEVRSDETRERGYYFYPKDRSPGKEGT